MDGSGIFRIIKADGPPSTRTSGVSAASHTTEHPFRAIATDKQCCCQPVGFLPADFKAVVSEVPNAAGLVKDQTFRNQFGPGPDVFLRGNGPPPRLCWIGSPDPEFKKRVQIVPATAEENLHRSMTGIAPSPISAYG